MARARNIKPGFFRNADLVELPVEARLLFIGLWTIADREGRLKDRPKQIKMEIFPADNFDCDFMLQQIADVGMIARYEHGGTKYLQITNFAKHQNPHKDEQASTIPAQGTSYPAEAIAPCKPDAGTMQAPCKPDAGTEVARLIPDTGFLIPDTKGESAARAVPEKKPSASVEKPDDVDEQVWADWVQLRKAKRTTASKTAVDGAREEAQKAGMTLGEFLKVWCRRGSQGLEAAWLKPNERPQPASHQPKTFAERDREAGWGRWEEQTGRIHPERVKAGNPSGQVIDITPRHLEIAQ